VKVLQNSNHHGEFKLGDSRPQFFLLRL
jgi:hypothetical protein